ncbi:hypothetical protein SB6415_00286 [Klebsiella pasteurii]|uniref:hypothetical protein n=1 Tax=Klebsiella TaxID=570 RepID=UPI0011590413|nr:MULTISPECIES: hypothetical protein [Klebsiella]MBD0902493.1 hypothetical protein [Klebsiella grimontii]VUS60439.1 hypothetical protein SB6415_00286 [Klebsiella pasteurii]
MSEVESLLKTMLDCDAFHNEDGKVSGIAKAAIAKGFDSLSVPQKKVLEPFLSHECGGVTDPGGYSNDCEKLISGSELQEAYELQGHYGDLLCQDCREESDGYDIERERFMRD